MVKLRMSQLEADSPLGNSKGKPITLEAVSSIELINEKTFQSKLLTLSEEGHLLVEGVPLEVPSTEQIMQPTEGSGVQVKRNDYSIGYANTLSFISGIPEVTVNSKGEINIPFQVQVVGAGISNYVEVSKINLQEGLAASYNEETKTLSLKSSWQSIKGYGDNKVLCTDQTGSLVWLDKTSIKENNKDSV